MMTTGDKIKFAADEARRNYRTPISFGRALLASLIEAGDLSASLSVEQLADAAGDIWMNYSL